MRLKNKSALVTKRKIVSEVEQVITLWTIREKTHFILLNIFHWWIIHNMYSPMCMK